MKWKVGDHVIAHDGRGAFRGVITVGADSKGLYTVTFQIPQCLFGAAGATQQWFYFEGELSPIKSGLDLMLELL